MRKFPCIIASLACLVSMPCHAENAQGADGAPPELQNQGDAFVNSATDFSWTLDVSTDKSSTTVGYGGYLVTGSSGAGNHSTDMTWAVNAELPIGGKDNLAASSTLDRLNTGPKLSVSVNLMVSPKLRDLTETASFNDLMDAARRKCKEEVGEQDLSAADAAQQLDICTNAANTPQFVKKYLPSGRLAMNRLLFQGYWEFGLEGSIGTDEFDFVTPGTFAKDAQRLTGWSVKGSIGYSPSDGVSALRFGVEFQRAPEELDKGIVCKAVVVSPSDDCSFSLSRAPRLEDSLIIRSEYRRFFPFSDYNGGIGIAVTGSYDALGNEWGFEFPVYLEIPGTTAILPGITFGYTSKKDKLTVGVFLKTAFSF